MDSGGTHLQFVKLQQNLGPNFANFCVQSSVFIIDVFLTIQSKAQSTACRANFFPLESFTVKENRQMRTFCVESCSDNETFRGELELERDVKLLDTANFIEINFVYEILQWNM